MQLTPKERFKLATAHKETDRPVIDLQWSPEIMDVQKKYFKTDEEGIFKIFRGDVRSVGPDYVGPSFKKLPDGSIENHFGYRQREVATPFGKSSQTVYNPLAGMETIDDFRKGYSFPPYEYYNFDAVREKTRRHGQYALNAGWWTIWYMYFYLRGMEQSLMDMLVNPEFFHYVMKAVADWWRGYMKRVLERGNGAIDYVMTYEDFGTTEGLLASRANIRDHVLVYYRDFAGFLADYGARFAFHSCGSIHEVIPDLLNLGVSILDPIQVSAKGMDIKFLKENYGDKLTFRGGIDTTRLLPNGTKEEVKEKARQTIDILGKNGGYIFCSSNQTNPDTPRENVLAMYEAVLGDEFWKK